MTHPPTHANPHPSEGRARRGAPLAAFLLVALSLLLAGVRAPGLDAPAAGAATSPADPTSDGPTSDGPTSDGTGTEVTGSDTGNATFGIGPASGVGQGDGRSAFNYSVTPGAGLSDGVTVSNIGLTPLTLSVYATDAVPGTNGSADLLAADVTPTDAGAWIDLDLPGDGRTLDIPPRSNVVVPFHAVVPAAARPGDHAAGIIASLRTKAKSAQGDDIDVDQRVATRMFFRVSGDLTTKLTVSDLHATYQQNLSPVGLGSVVVTYTVHNEGNIKLGATQKVEFDGPFGTTAEAHGVEDIPVLLPGASLTRTVRLTDVPPELYGSAVVTLQPVAAVGDQDVDLSPISGRTRLLTLPLALAALVAVLLTLRWYLRRRHRRRHLAAAPPTNRAQKVTA